MPLDAGREVTPGKGNPSDAQLAAMRMLGGPQTHMLFYGGARSGKTFIFTRGLIVRALKAPGSRHAILRLKAAHAYSSIWTDTIPKVRTVCMPWLDWRPNDSLMWLRLPNKSEIWVGGLDDKDRVEKILGQEHASLYFVEASQIPWTSRMMAITRLAQKINQADGVPLKVRSYQDLNPVGETHWSNQLFVRHLEPGTKRALDPSEIADLTYMRLNPEDNRQNLPPGYIENTLGKLPERFRQRFKDGVYQTEVDNPLWTMSTLDAVRLAPVNPGDQRLARIVVGVDPSGSTGDENTRSNEVGIVVAGRFNPGAKVQLDDGSVLDVSDAGVMLEDGSLKHPSPGEWGQRTNNLYEKWGADCVAAERNFGGGMVESTLLTASRAMHVKLVTASRGKHIRAEPVAALYEETPARPRMFYHAGVFPEMEEQMLQFSTAGYEGDRSPDRADAGVWAATELMLDPDEVDIGIWRKL